jgi:hypothetical protein
VEILREEAPAADAPFDVFLSHSIKDAETILAVKRLAQAGRLRVYVDWLDDPVLDRDRVTPETAGGFAGKNAILFLSRLRTLTECFYVGLDAMGAWLFRWTEAWFCLDTANSGAF